MTDFYDIVSLTRNRAIGDAIAYALKVDISAVMGRRYYYEGSTKRIYLFEGGNPRLLVECFSGPIDDGCGCATVVVPPKPVECDTCIKTFPLLMGQEAPVVGRVVVIVNEVAYPTDGSDPRSVTGEIGIVIEVPSATTVLVQFPVSRVTLAGFEFAAGQIFIGADGLPTSTYDPDLHYGLIGNSDGGDNFRFATGGRSL